MAAPVDIAGPAGSGIFGQRVKVLPNGNFVVTDPYYDAPGPVQDVGAVYVYCPAGVLISTLTGSQKDDYVGIYDIVVLEGGRFAVISHFWNGAAARTGAVTWGDMTNGVSGVVSAANSLTGTKADDRVGSGGLVPLTNGSCVVISPLWDNTVDTLNVVDAGAVTWCDGTTGRTGAVGEGNSLTGSKAGDQVGSIGVTALTNGNYVVRSILWDNGAVFNAGAVTWGNGTTGISGIVSAANSLTSDRNSTQTGSVTALTNGNYVVSSFSWEPDAASPSDIGAVTWCSGTTGRSGLITPGNSFAGSDNGDSFGGVVALTDGNYVAYSVNWTRPGDTNSPSASAGAVTWGNGFTGLTGSVTAANSLIGDSNGANVGQSVVPLPGGKFVVVSPGWDDAAAGVNGISKGAVTFCASAAACTGIVSNANSLTGAVASSIAQVQHSAGSGGVTALTNGNYVVSSPMWEIAAQTPADPVDAGAVTFCSGAGGSTGVIGLTNSVTGSTRNDRLGRVTALTNGNYVISEGRWDAGSVADVGFARWCDGSAAATGAVSAANALIGSTASDSVGDVTPLSDGNYIVQTGGFDYGGLTNSGAITFCSGTGGTTGVISAANSVLGTVANGGINMNFAYDAPRRQLIVGRPGSNLVTLWTAPSPATPLIPKLSTPVLLTGGAIRFSFTGLPGTAYTVITSQELNKPYSQWGVLGIVPEITPGQFEYTSPPSTVPRRFFAVQVP